LRPATLTLMLQLDASLVTLAIWAVIGRFYHAPCQEYVGEPVCRHQDRPFALVEQSMARRGQGIGNAGFELDDYEMLDYAQYDVVFAYFSPVAVEPPWQKALREIQPADG
jgi:hypothetical protein